MAMLDKWNAKLMRKALNTYLPSTRSTIVQLEAPVRTTALRVWIYDDDAHDYFVANRYWWETPVDSFLSSEPNNTTIAANSGVQLLPALIAGRIVGICRQIAFPLQSDASFRSGASDPTEIDHAKALLAESYGFLVALSTGRIPFTDNADQLAHHLVERFSAEIEQSGEESK